MEQLSLKYIDNRQESSQNFTLPKASKFSETEPLNLVNALLQKIASTSVNLRILCWSLTIVVGNVVESEDFL